MGGLRFIDTTEVTIVNVDVAVRDKDGPVSGLTRDDFVVYQDGAPQELTNFYFYTSPLAEEGETPAATTCRHPISGSQLKPVFQVSS